jgi:4-amino-4-deoxy-L-arabinose transferase-like glycosyltransferase
MNKQRVSARIPWLWVLAAFVIASTRLSEVGLGLDPTLFASIARTMSRLNIWWSPSASNTLFPQFAEHPYLAIWLQALIFKVAGISDWSARILGASLGSLSFFFLFRLGEMFVGLRFAHLYCLAMLLSAHFIGRMASFFFDVPMLFFSLAGLYAGALCLIQKKFRVEMVGGLCFGAAFLTKGAAALPLFVMLPWMYLVWRGYRALWDRSLYLMTVVALICVLGFLGLQDHFGSYSFWDLYLQRQMATKGARPLISSELIRIFFGANVIQILLAIPCFYYIRQFKEVRRAVVYGVGATFLLAVALSQIERVLYHYFYIVYPFLNLLVAASLYGATHRRGYKIRWEKVALGFAVFYAVLWHLIPVSMRRKPEVDYLQLKGVVSALKSAGVPALQGIGISHFDWVYRETSLWYWDMETDVPAAESDPTSVSPTRAAVIAPRSPDLEKKINGAGYKLCALSPKFQIWVRTTSLEQACRDAALPTNIVR